MKKKTARKVNVSAYIPLEDLEKLEDLSRQKDTSISALVCEAIHRFLERSEVES